MVELMVTLSVVATLAAIAAPSFSGMLAGGRIKRASSDLEATLAEARSQAVRLGKRYTVCISDTGTACATSGDWTQGWISFTDLERNDAGGKATLDSGESVETRVAAVPGDIKIVGNGSLAQFVSYSADGQSRLMNGAVQTGTIRVCSTSGAVDNAHRARDLVVEATGRVSVVTPGSVSASCEAAS